VASAASCSPSRSADPARYHGDGDIARMVESRVPPHASGQLAPRVQAQGHRRDRRTEDVADNCHQAVRDQRPLDCEEASAYEVPWFRVI
jgi:hypothetical protein